MSEEKIENPIYCSFCGKSERECELMIAGPVRTFICDECVALCVETIAKQRREREWEKRIELEIREFHQMAEGLGIEPSTQLFRYALDAQGMACPI